MSLDRVEDAVAAIAAGELVVVVDDADRENEGDLIMAATKATPEKIGFMVRHTSGIICVPMTPARAQALNLAPMVATNADPFRTAFTVSVDYREGLTTGISAAERSATIRALAAGNSHAEDFLRPGHIFPLIAKPGGVLARSGHTEAGVDLARLAGFEPVGVLAEIVNDDGTLKRLPELLAFAREQGLKIVSIEDLIAYRLQHEALVTRVAEEDVTLGGLAARAVVYESGLDRTQHVALVIGEVAGHERVPVRVYREQPLADLLARAGGRGDWALEALEAIRARGGSGVILMLRGPSIDDAPAANAGATPEEGSERHQSARRRMAAWREVGVGAQILRELGVCSIALLSASGRPYVGLGGYGIEIAETILL